jgi:uncharacterized OB-fold protein/putative sterol carrier protein
VQGVDVTIGYDISGEGGGKWVVTIKDAVLKVVRIEGAMPKCSVILSADAESFVGGALGKVDPGEAFSSGKLKVSGDLTILGNVLPKAFEKFTPRVRAHTIVESMVERFRPDKAEGVDMRIGYDLSGKGGGRWTISIRDKTCIVKKGVDTGCTVVMRMDAEVFVDLNLGKLDGATAFSSGKVRIDGDMSAAGATAKLFKKYELPGEEKQGEELISLKCVTSINQRFATGPHMGKWFAGLKEKKLYASQCPLCGRTQIPPREICAVCRVRADEFVEVGPKATVVLVDVVYYASPDPLTGKVRQTPYGGVFMVLDGASPGESFAHELKPADIDRVKPGMRVRAVWAEQRTGSFTDLPYFEIDD